MTSSAIWYAAHVPTTTGAAETGSVRGRAPATHLFMVTPSLAGESMAGESMAGESMAGESWTVREPLELGPTLLEVRLLAFLRLFGHVVEERRVTGELLDAGEAVVGGV